MKNSLLALILLFSTGLTFAGKLKPIKPVKDAKEKTGFWHHCGEFHITPSTDYFIFRQGDVMDTPEPYEFNMPFIGFNMGGQYMYRPVEVFAISTGLNFRMQGAFYRHKTTPLLQSTYVDYRSYGHQGLLQVPLEFHLFKRLTHSTFEFATGPQFNFPLFTTYRRMDYNTEGDKTGEISSKTKYDTDYMRDYASLGWNIMLGGEVHLCDKSDLFIGPQINFTNIALFDKDINNDRRKSGDQYNCSLGLKLGFRFHCENTMGYE